MTNNPMEDFVLFDVDGTIADLHTEWVSIYNQETGDNLEVSNITDWYIPPFMPRMSIGEIVNIISDPTIYDAVKPYPGAVEFVKSFVQKGFPVGFVSHCLLGTVDAKYLWLKHHGFLDNYSRFIPMDGEMRRHVVVRALFDDKQETIQGLRHGWIVTRPWNRKMQHHHRITDWAVDEGF